MGRSKRNSGVALPSPREARLEQLQWQRQYTPAQRRFLWFKFSPLDYAVLPTRRIRNGGSRQVMGYTNCRELRISLDREGFPLSPEIVSTLMVLKWDDEAGWLQFGQRLAQLGHGQWAEKIAGAINQWHRDKPKRDKYDRQREPGQKTAEQQAAHGLKRRKTFS